MEFKKYINEVKSLDIKIYLGKELDYDEVSWLIEIAEIKDSWYDLTKKILIVKGKYISNFKHSIENLDLNKYIDDEDIMEDYENICRNLINKLK